MKDKIASFFYRHTAIAVVLSVLAFVVVALATTPLAVQIQDSYGRYALETRKKQLEIKYGEQAKTLYLGVTEGGNRYEVIKLRGTGTSYLIVTDGKSVDVCRVDSPTGNPAMSYDNGEY